MSKGTELDNISGFEKGIRVKGQGTFILFMRCRTWGVEFRNRSQSTRYVVENSWCWRWVLVLEMSRWRAHEIHCRVPCVQLVQKYLEMFVTVLLFLMCLMEAETSAMILFPWFY